MMNIRVVVDGSDAARDVLHHLLPFLHAEYLKQIRIKSRSVPIPLWAEQVKHITLGKLCALQATSVGITTITDINNFILTGVSYDSKRDCAGIIRWLNSIYTRACLRYATIGQVMRLYDKLVSDIELFSNRFDAATLKQTSEEKAAMTGRQGSLQDLAFWFARRQGMSDVNDAFLTSIWVILRAYEMDMNDAKFQRNLINNERIKRQIARK
jgi:hypothetical protein